MLRTHAIGRRKYASSSLHRTTAEGGLRDAAARRQGHRRPRLRSLLPLRPLSAHGVHRRAPRTHDAWITLAGLARETERIRLGALVTAGTFRPPWRPRHPGGTGRRMAGARVELGLGSGWYEAEHEAYGIRFTRERFGRPEEQLAVVTGLWNTPVGDRFTYEGAFCQLKDSPALPKPAQSRVPVLIGGHGAKRTPALDARYADEFDITLASLRRRPERPRCRPPPVAQRSSGRPASVGGNRVCPSPGQRLSSKKISPSALSLFAATVAPGTQGASHACRSVAANTSSISAADSPVESSEARSGLHQQRAPGGVLVQQADVAVAIGRSGHCDGVRNSASGGETLRTASPPSTVVA
ncbi:LLM class flavin-dependent oxidoreductase [Streptomyces sp. AS58]|uniref:LLM class flavin-dependent oxidoreductase n=1 Tax=Streptomyces sp. AS58 TaxID=1519489 RepID=UPI00099D49CD